MSTPIRKPALDCARFVQSISPYVDGELDPGHAVDVEAHVLGCSPCAERVALIRSMRQSMKRRCASRAGDALRARIGATLCAERRREAEIREAEARADEEPMAPKLVRLRYAVGVAAAAGVVFALGMSRHIQTTPSDNVRAESDTQNVTRSSIDGMIDELVSMHANPYPPETTSLDDLPRFDPLVEVKVPQPTFKLFNASFAGARLHSLPPATRRAAMLQMLYTMRGGHRLTMYVFNPAVVSVRTTRLEPRMEPEKRVVYVGHVRGYSVAAGEERGVGYAIASDLSDDENAEVALAAVR
ncbi:MAG: zf-HC2 domain-containing protein [Byssovorax sp.]